MADYNEVMRLEPNSKAAWSERTKLKEEAKKDKVLVNNHEKLKMELENVVKPGKEDGDFKSGVAEVEKPQVKRTLLTHSLSGKCWS